MPQGRSAVRPTNGLYWPLIPLKLEIIINNSKIMKIVYPLE